MEFYRVAATAALTVFLLVGCNDETEKFYTTGETVYTAKFVLDFDQDGLAHYPFGPDLDDDNDGLLTRFAGGSDVDDQDPAIGRTGKGNGNFSPPDFYWGTQDDPEWTGFGDFNADGWLDPVVLESSIETIGVALNRGNKDIDTAIQYGVDSYDDKYPTVGDFNKDGKLDIALVSATGVKIAWGNGDGYFTSDSAVAAIPPNNIVKVVTADFDLDGNLDLAATDSTNDDIVVVFGDGAGSFGSTATLDLASADANTACGLAFGHLNGDAHLDLVAMRRTGTSEGVSAFLNNGDRTFQTEATTVLAVETQGGYVQGQDLALGDYDEDGDLDLITRSTTSGSMLYADGDNDGTFSGATLIPFGLTSYYRMEAVYNIGDIDGDGHLDAFTTEDDEETMVILSGQGDGTFIVGIIAVGIDMEVVGAAIADFNGDGIFDIAFHTDSSDEPQGGLYVLWGWSD